MRYLMLYLFLGLLLTSCRKDNKSLSVKSTKISFKLNGVYHELNGEMTYNPLPVTGCIASYIPISPSQPSILSIGYSESSNVVLGININNVSNLSGNYQLIYGAQNFGDFSLFIGLGGPYALFDPQVYGPNYINISYNITNGRLSGKFSGVIIDWRNNYVPVNLTEGKMDYIPLIQ
jgi:hypothetical protein